MGSEKSINKIPSVKIMRYVIMLIAVILMIGVIVWFALSKTVLVDWRTNKGFDIDSEYDFIEAIKHSDRTKESYNYSVTKSFEVDVTKIPEGKFFYGNLNGNGNMIALTSKNEAPMTHPIFDKIQKGAVIDRLTIVADIVLGEDDNLSDVSLLANCNLGTIKNCSISVQNIFIGNKCSNASALFNDNFGEINSVCVNVSRIYSSQTQETWHCNFGTLATVNYSSVKNVFAKVEFDELDIFRKDYDNHNVGYMFGKIGVKANECVSDIYLFGDNEFWEYSVDVYWLGNNISVSFGIPDFKTVTDFVNYNSESQQSWLASTVDEETGFPILSK